MATSKYQPLTFTPINFSLTEGTNIPAPPDSPPDTPRQRAPGKGPLSSHPNETDLTSPSIDAADAADMPGAFPPTPSEQLTETTAYERASSTLSPAPVSPTLTKRPSSVRKFLGLRTLSSSDSLKSDRPGSPDTTATSPSLKRKKSASWFGKRKSTMIVGRLDEGTEHTPSATNGHIEEEKKKGPPPPALPELKSFGVSEDTINLGAEDMFKNIK